MPSDAIVDGKMGSTVGKQPPGEAHRYGRGAGRRDETEEGEGQGRRPRAGAVGWRGEGSRGGCLRESYYRAAPPGATRCAPPFQQWVARLATSHPTEVGGEWSESDRACDHSK
eukprot:348582-Pleurochrysis_carterae.AAC.4